MSTDNSFTSSEIQQDLTIIEKKDTISEKGTPLTSKRDTLNFKWGRSEPRLYYVPKERNFTYEI